MKTNENEAYRNLHSIKGLNKKLIEFGFEIYTVLNQIFGSPDVINILQEIFPSEKYEFIYIYNKCFDDCYNDNQKEPNHHALKHKQTKEILCSIQKGYQDINTNINDNLCYLWQKLIYFDIPISKSMFENQMSMIKMIRSFMNDERFIDLFNERILIPNYNNGGWIIHRPFTKNNRIYYLKMEKVYIIRKINDVLQKWEKYGFLYFIGDGKFHKKLNLKNNIKINNISLFTMYSNNTLVLNTYRNNNKILIGIGITTLVRDSDSIRDNLRQTVENFKKNITEEYEHDKTLGGAYVGEVTAKAIKHILISTLTTKNLWVNIPRENGKGTTDYFRYNRKCELIIDRFLKKYDINIIEHFQVCEHCNEYINIADDKELQLPETPDDLTCYNTEENDENIDDDEYVENPNICGFRCHEHCIRGYLHSHPECSRDTANDLWLCHKCI